MEEMNTSLQEREWMWAGSIETLYSNVLTGKGLAIANTVRTVFVLQLMNIARLLGLDSWMIVKETLFKLLLGHNVEDSSGICWDDLWLLGEIHDRY
jgi:hypothetical protein